MQHEGYPIHPHAAAFCRVAGIPKTEAQDLLSEVAMNTPLLVGGYFIDAVILSLWWALSTDAEDNAWTHTDIIERVVESIHAAWGEET